MRGDNPQGTVAEQRAAHYSAWQSLLREDRVLMTLDHDFSDVRAYPPEDTSGIVVFRVRSLDKPFLIGHLNRIMSLLKQEALKGRLRIVEENRVRIRGGDSI